MKQSNTGKLTDHRDEWTLLLIALLIPMASLSSMIL
jgi:hypothetical protein